jgi:hypothetical protein
MDALSWKCSSTEKSWAFGPPKILLLNRFPKGYRYLAYLQTRIGYTVKKDMPQSEGPELEDLYRSGALWLQGGSKPSSRSPGTIGQYLLKTAFGPARVQSNCASVREGGCASRVSSSRIRPRISPTHDKGAS